MGSLKLYCDMLSQPARALRLFLLINKVPHEAISVNLAKGEHLMSDFKQINPHRKVPVLEHNGFLLTESVAIFRYLCRELNLPDHWYPKDSKKQARVDEYLEWQHLNTRLFCAMYFREKALAPMLTGNPVDEKMIKFYQKGMEGILDALSNKWLKNTKYLCGEEISVADLLGFCELEQPRMAGYDVTTDRPVIKAYMDRVRTDLQPHYGEVGARLEKFCKKYRGISAKL